MDISLYRQFNVSGYGGLIFPADINNDGISEFLVLQSPGLFHAEIHKNLLTSEDGPGRDHFCLTAIDSSGEIIWQIGDPWQYENPWPTHGGERSLCVYDLDGDGKKEVYVIRGNSVLGLDSKTGAIIREFALPYDNFINLLPGRVAEGSDGCRLLASPSNESYENHSHGGPTIVFDQQGNKVFERDIFGFGHDPVAFDFNDDGVDEWLVGYELLDHDFSSIWKFQPCPEDEYDGNEMHVDGLSLYWPRENDMRRIAYAASSFLYVIDMSGNLVWEKELVHPQQVHFGFYRQESQLPQLFVLNKRDDLQLFDFDGNELWSVTPEENWPHSKPENLKNKFHLFDPTVKIKNDNSETNDIIIYCEGGWPYGIDGKGRRVIEFECPIDTTQPACDEKYRRPDDYGWGYSANEFKDKTGHYLAIFDRKTLCLYKIRAK